MSEEFLVDFGSPTLAGLKTGSLFSCAYEAKEELYRDIRSLNRRLSSKGVRLIPLRLEGSRALIFLYRPKMLETDLASPEAAEILRSEGYEDVSSSHCLARLAKRLRERREFPHEIGLFLGYPPEDVRGFMEHKGKNSKLTGIWKVYGDAEAAENTFAKYRKCTSCYQRYRKMGLSLESLTVAYK